MSKSLNKQQNHSYKSNQGNTSNVSPLLFNNLSIWLNSKEAAEYLRISVENLRVKVSRGEIQVDGRLGKCLRFRREKLQKLLESSIKGDFND